MGSQADPPNMPTMSRSRASVALDLRRAALAERVKIAFIVSGSHGRNETSRLHVYESGLSEARRRLREVVSTPAQVSAGKPAADRSCDHQGRRDGRYQLLFL